MKKLNLLLIVMSVSCGLRADEPFFKPLTKEEKIAEIRKYLNYHLMRS